MVSLLCKNQMVIKFSLQADFGSVCYGFAFALYVTLKRLVWTFFHPHEHFTDLIHFKINFMLYMTSFLHFSSKFSKAS